MTNVTGAADAWAAVNTAFTVIAWIAVLGFAVAIVLMAYMLIRGYARAVRRQHVVLPNKKIYTHAA